jgi:hypothetical protein
MQDQAIDLLKEVRDDVKQLIVGQAIHKEQIKEVLGNGKPGRLTITEQKVEDLDKLKYKAIGYGLGVLAAMEVMHALFSAGLGTIIHK